MFQNNTLDTINNEIITIIKDFVVSNNILPSIDVGDKVFSSKGLNIAILTRIANEYDIEDLIEENASKYEDGGLGFDNNILVDNIGMIGIETIITIDSGNQASSQSALSENGFCFVELYNYFKTLTLPKEWKLYKLVTENPSFFPFQSSNIYSLITIRGLYAV